jgi:hypothetical protein
MHDDHRVPLPWIGSLFIPDAAPQIDDLLAPAIGAARTAEFAAPDEILGKRVMHGLEAVADVSFDGGLRWCGYRHDSLRSVTRDLSEP